MTPRMSKLATTAICAAACGIFSLASIGCDALESSGDKADKKISQAVNNNADKVRAGGDQAASAGNELKSVVNEPDASLPTKVNAYNMLYSASLAQVQPNLHSLDKDQVDIATLSWKIQLAADRIDIGNRMIKGYQAMDPGADDPKADAPQNTQKLIAQEIGRIKGTSKDSNWVEGDGTDPAQNIPSEVQLQQRKSLLSGQIMNLRQNIQGLLEQHEKTLAEAEDVISKSNAAQGNQAVDLFRKGTDLRMKAASLRIQADMAAAKILPLQSDLAMTESQLQVIQEAQKHVEQQAAQVTTGWDKVKEQSSLLAQQSRDLLEKGSTDPNDPNPSINTMVEELSTLVAKSTETRASAEQTLTQAAGYAQDAAKNASNFKKDLPQSKSQVAMAELASAMNPGVYKLKQGQVLHTLAMSKAAQYRNLVMVKAAQDRLANALKGANLPMPAKLNDPTLGEQVKAAATAANDAFDTANQALMLVPGMPGVSSDLISSAATQQIITQYAWYQLATEAKLPNAADHLNEVNRLSGESKDRNAVLPSLPIDSDAAKVPAATPSDNGNEQ